MKREDKLTQGELENRVLRALPGPEHPPVRPSEVLARTGFKGETVQSVLRRLAAADQAENIHLKGWRRTVDRPAKIRSRQAQALEMAEAYMDDLPWIEREESEIYANAGQALVLTGGEEGVREGRVTVISFDGTIMEAPVGTWDVLRWKGAKADA